MREAEAVGRPPLEPRDVVEVRPFGIVTTGPRGASSRVSAEIASETHVIASAAAGDEPRDARVQRRLRLRGGRVRAPVRVRDERVAQIGDPADARARAIAAAIRCVEGGGDVGDDGVDAVLSQESNPGRDGGAAQSRLVRDDVRATGAARA